MTDFKIPILTYIEKINSLNIKDFEDLTNVYHVIVKNVICNNLYPSSFGKDIKPYIDMHNVVYVKLNKELFGDINVNEIMASNASNIISIDNFFSFDELFMIDKALVSLK